MNNYFIIEKENASIEAIRSVLTEINEFNFIGASGDKDFAMNSILKETPDVVFLCVDDIINNPFQLLKDLNIYMDRLPLVIAMSKTKDKAYEAIKSDFHDYLLKPLKELDIRKTLLKATKEKKFQLKSTVCLKSYKDYKYLNTDEILFLKADNNTTDFYMKDGNTISAFKTLKTYEELLPQNFLRIHKSYIINSKYVSGINYGKLMCTINKCSYNIPFTKTYISNIEGINKTLSNSSFISLN